MKRSILLPFFIFIISHVFSQSLAGDWKGKCATNVSDGLNLPWDFAEKKATSMNLRFIFNKDSTYSVYSFTEISSRVFGDTVVVCKVAGQVLNDSVFLQETRVLLPADYPQSCLQKMFLKIIRKKKYTELNGTWESKGNNCNSTGTIYFRKENE